MASARTTILDGLDPARILHSGDPPKAPSYVNQLGQYNADNAMALGNYAAQYVPGMYAGAIAGANQLDPHNNQFLTQAQREGQYAASGATGNGILQNAREATQSAWATNNNVNPYLRNQADQLGASAQDLGVIRNSAMGNGPSAAEHLARAQLDSNIRAQAAMAGQARGGNVAAAGRNAALAGSQMQLQSQQQMAAMRAQEQLNAQSLLNQGNASLMTGAGNLSQNAQANANQFGQVANQATIQGATNLQLAGQGMNAMVNAGDSYGRQAASAQDARLGANDAFAKWLQNQYSISNGIGVGAGTATSNAASTAYGQQQQQAGANASLLGGLVSAIL